MPHLYASVDKNMTLQVGQEYPGVIYLSLMISSLTPDPTVATWGPTRTVVSSTFLVIYENGSIHSIVEIQPAS